MTANKMALKFIRNFADRNVFRRSINTTSNLFGVDTPPNFRYGLLRIDIQNENKRRNTELTNTTPFSGDDKNVTTGVISADLLDVANEGKKAKLIQQKSNQIKKRFSQNENCNVKVEGEILFGIHPVLLALHSGKRTCHKLYMKRRQIGNLIANSRLEEIKVLAKNLKLSMEEIPGKFLDRLSGQRPHQSVCMDCTNIKKQFYDENNTFESEVRRPAVWLVLNNIHDPMNLGAIIRTSYFMGVDKILSTEIDSCPLTPVVSKASSGAMEIAPFFYIRNLEEFLTIKKSSGWDIVGTTTNSEILHVTDLRDFKLNKSTILVIGNEGTGLRENILNLCTKYLYVKPGQQTSEKLTSLNVSVATGIILHSIFSSHGKKVE